MAATYDETQKELNRIFKGIYTDDVLKQFFHPSLKKKLYTDKEWKRLKKTNLGKLALG